MTPEEQEAQRRSFAYGNTAIGNPAITRELVDEVATQDKPMCERGWHEFNWDRKAMKFIDPCLLCGHLRSDIDRVQHPEKSARYDALEGK